MMTVTEFAKKIKCLSSSSRIKRIQKKPSSTQMRQQSSLTTITVTVSLLIATVSIVVVVISCEIAIGTSNRNDWSTVESHLFPTMIFATAQPTEDERTFQRRRRRRRSSIPAPSLLSWQMDEEQPLQETDSMSENDSQYDFESCDNDGCSGNNLPESSPSIDDQDDKMNGVEGQDQEGDRGTKSVIKEASDIEKASNISRRRELFEWSMTSHARKLLANIKGEDDDLNMGASKNKHDVQEKDASKTIKKENRCVLFTDAIVDDVKVEDKLKIEKDKWEWTYRLCPGNSVTQLHISPSDSFDPSLKKDKSRSDNEIDPKKVTVSYHLGVYLDPMSLPHEAYLSSIRKARGVDEDIEEILSWEQIDYYVGGEKCFIDLGNGKKDIRSRSTEVRVEKKCCSPLEGRNTHDSVGEMMIQSVDEPEPCRYVMDICRICTPGGEEEIEVVEKEETKIEGKYLLREDILIENIFSDENLELLDDSSSQPLSHETDKLKHLAHTYLRGGSHSPLGNIQPTLDPSDSILSPSGYPPMPPSKMQSNLDLIKAMFTHSYDSYMYNAYPASELKPLTCQPGKFDLVKLQALTLIDTLDTFVVMGNYTEFARAVERIRDLDRGLKPGDDHATKDFNIGHHRQGGLLFAVDVEVSVFETNIRVLGGLLSAHQLAEAYIKDKVLESDVLDDDGNVLLGEMTQHKKKEENMPSGNVTVADDQPPIYWSYDGMLLRLARDLGHRLLPAFQTPTGIPYGTVNLLRGIPPGETPIASLAGGGTLSLEMELLSRLTGDESFGQAAKLASRAIWLRRSADLNLLGKHIDVKSGKWTETLSGIGSNSDSFYEYLVKHYTVFPDDDDFWTMFVNVYDGVHYNSRKGDWYADVDMFGGLKGTFMREVFESLMAFYPGMQTLLGELTPAAQTLNSFFLVREFLGFLPERFNYGRWSVDLGGGKHPLRPELLESCYFLHLASNGLKLPSIYDDGGFGLNRTKIQSSSGWLWAADFALHALYSLTRTKCGFATVEFVSPNTSGFLGSVLLNQGNSIQNKHPLQGVALEDEMPSYFLSETLKYLFLTFDDDNILHTDADREWIFTTEAHPIHHVLSDGQEKGRRDADMSRTGELWKGCDERRSDARIEKIKSKVLSLLKNGISSISHSTRHDASPTDYVTQTWSTKTKMDNYHSNIQHVQQSIVQKKEHRLVEESCDLCNKDFGLIPTIVNQVSHVSSLNVDDVFGHELLELNLANLAFSQRGIGDGSSLQKSCPNFYHPNIRWIHALDGHLLDYNDPFLSSSSDKNVGAKDEIHNNEMKNALASASFYGTKKLVSGDLARRDKICIDDNGQKPPIDNEDNLEKSNEEETPTPGTQRFDMGGELGAFDFSSHSNNVGFFVKQVKSGEALEATVVQDVEAEGKDTEIYVLVSSNTPSSVKRYGLSGVATNESSNVLSRIVSWRPSGARWSSLFSKYDSTEDPDILAAAEQNSHGFWKTVVMADFGGNSFSCNIFLKRRKGARSPESAGAEKEEQILVVLPCAPAVFGPTRLPELVDNNGIVVEAEIRVPPTANEMGCDFDLAPDAHCDYDKSMRPDFDTDDFCSSNSTKRQDGRDGGGIIQIIKRGECAFVDKVRNQSQQHNAKAVIVVNTESDKVFVMASGSLSHSKLDNFEDQLPPSVMVTKEDGEQMINIIREFEVDKEIAGPSDEVIIASVEIQANTVPMDAGTNINFDAIQWPVVRSSPGTMQVFASNGWGVHAISHSQKKGGEIEWQMFIFGHDGVNSILKQPEI